MVMVMVLVMVSHRRQGEKADNCMRSWDMVVAVLAVSVAGKVLDYSAGINQILLERRGL